MPKRSSKRRHSCGSSGAELEVMKRSDGTSCAPDLGRRREQHVDHGRIAGGDGDAVGANVVEEPRRREFLRHHQRGAARERRQHAEQLRRGPVERAEVVDAVVGGDAEALGHRHDVGELLAIAQHHALRRVARPRGEEDHAVVARGRLGEKTAPRRHRDRRPQKGCRRPAHRSGRWRGAPRSRRQLDAVVMDDEARPQAAQGCAGDAAGSSRHGRCISSRHRP